MDVAEDIGDIGIRRDIATDADLDITGDHHNKWNKEDPKRKHLILVN